MDQLSLFEQEEVKQCEPEPKTTVRLGKKAVQIPLAKKRREAIAKLMPILKELEGKDIYIDSYDAGAGTTGYTLSSSLGSKWTCTAALIPCLQLLSSGAAETPVSGYSLTTLIMSASRNIWAIRNGYLTSTTAFGRAR